MKKDTCVHACVCACGWVGVRVHAITRVCAFVCVCACAELGMVVVSYISIM